MKMPGESNKNDNIGYKTFVVSAKVVIRVLVIVLFIFIVIFLSRKAYSLGYEVASYEPESIENPEDISVTITMDMSVRDVGNLLIEKGIIDESIEAFLIQERLSDYHNMFLPGVYMLNSTMSIDDILGTISTPVSEDEETGNDN